MSANIAASRASDEPGRPDGDAASAAEGTACSPHVVSYPWQEEGHNVVAWSRTVCELIKQLKNPSEKPAYEDADISTDGSGPSTRKRLRPHQGYSSTARLIQQESESARWDTGDVRMHQNAVCQNAHGRCTHSLLGRFVPSQPLGDWAPVDFLQVPEASRVSVEDVILTVVLHDERGCKEQEHDVLASQTLAELKDAFYFVGDWMYDGPIRLGSGCMFIDGAFYSDTRQTSAMDYSIELIEWLQTIGHPLREAKARPMTLRICDLERIPFGEPCCFIRQGDVEHYMFFTGARLINIRIDCPLREGYPCLVWMRSYRRRRCVACEKNFASWVVLDSSRCPFNPAHFCRLCLKHFSERRDGSYISPIDYKVFPYLHEET